MAAGEPPPALPAAPTSFSIATPVETMKNSAPDVMRCLTEQFAAKSEVNERARIRRQMKALLDFLSADTTYPALPKAQAQANIFGNMAADVRQADYYIPEQRGGIAAIPGAENNAILEEGAA